MTMTYVILYIITNMVSICVFLVDLPLCINNLHALMPIIKKFKMNNKGEGLLF